jgi:hypothetical protein
VTVCAGAGAVSCGVAIFTTDFLTGALFFAAFPGGAFTAAFFTAFGAPFFATADFGFAASAQRFFMAALIAFLPAALSLRLGVEGCGVDGGLECFTGGFFAVREDACKVSLARMTEAFAVWRNSCPLWSVAGNRSIKSDSDASILPSLFKALVAFINGSCFWSASRRFNCNTTETFPTHLVRPRFQGLVIHCCRSYSRRNALF